MRVEFHGLMFDLPHGWLDITEDLPEGGPPSLARQNGVGTVQFTYAKYRSGGEPTVTIAILRNFLDEFFRKNNVSYDNIVDHKEGVLSVQGASISGSEFMLARYFSNGKDVVLATYVCLESDRSEMLEDLKGVETIMNSMEF